jgi:hypothetical protein
MLDVLPKTKAPIADSGYDSNWFRAALRKRGAEPCIPSTRSRKTPLPYEKRSIERATRSKTFSPNLRIGGELQHATAVAAGVTPNRESATACKRKGIAPK